MVRVEHGVVIGPLRREKWNMKIHCADAIRGGEVGGLAGREDLEGPYYSQGADVQPCVSVLKKKVRTRKNSRRQQTSCKGEVSELLFPRSTQQLFKVLGVE